MTFSTSLFEESPVLYGVVLTAFIVLFLVSYKVMALFIMCVVFFIIVNILLVWFYRYPSGQVENTNGILAPCDGLVDSLDYDPASGRYKVVVYLNILDMHHQYYPVTGIVTTSIHIPGSFYPALSMQKSQYNERHFTSLRTKHGEHIAITQIAGQFAHRIVNNSFPGLAVEQGERMGMIKLSSRVDIEFSKAHFIPTVAPGTRITARKTPIARRLDS